MVNNSFVLGRFKPADSFLHRLDTRVKIIQVCFLLLLLLLPSSIWFVLLLNGFLAGLLYSSLPSFKELLITLRSITMFLLITALFHIFFGVKEGNQLFSFGGFTLYSKAVYNAGYYTLRLLAFIHAAFILTLTSSPSALSDALARLLRPLRHLKIPVDDLALILFMALRFIPLLYEEFTLIRRAQQVRGVNFDGRLVSKIKKSVALLIPVLNASIRRADDIATALEVRGYGKADNRTYYIVNTLSIIDVVTLTGSGIFFSLLYYWLR